MAATGDLPESVIKKMKEDIQKKCEDCRIVLYDLKYDLKLPEIPPIELKAINLESGFVIQSISVTVPRYDIKQHLSGNGPCFFKTVSLEQTKAEREILTKGENSLLGRNQRPG